MAYRHHCFVDDDVNTTIPQWFDHSGQRTEVYGRPRLFAYPAQSNMNGRRLPVRWLTRNREEDCQQTFVLLDVAAYVSTSPIDLSDQKIAPDFLAISFYKIFGSPDLGALLVRRAAAHMFDKRRYFGGGTTEMVTCGRDPWVARYVKH